jgi:hypothetical protein
MTTISWLTLFKDIIAVYSKNRAKPINILWGYRLIQSFWVLKQMVYIITTVIERVNGIPYYALFFKESLMHCFCFPRRKRNVTGNKSCSRIMNWICRWAVWRHTRPANTAITCETGFAVLFYDIRSSCVQKEALLLLIITLALCIHKQHCHPITTTP